MPSNYIQIFLDSYLGLVKNEAGRVQRAQVRSQMRAQAGLNINTE